LVPVVFTGFNTSGNQPNGKILPTTRKITIPPQPMRAGPLPFPQRRFSNCLFQRTIRWQFESCADGRVGRVADGPNRVGGVLNVAAQLGDFLDFGVQQLKRLVRVALATALGGHAILEIRQRSLQIRDSGGLDAGQLVRGQGFDDGVGGGHQQAVVAFDVLADEILVAVRVRGRVFLAILLIKIATGFSGMRSI
jgi:hypothetical protein